MKKLLKFKPIKISPEKILKKSALFFKFQWKNCLFALVLFAINMALLIILSGQNLQWVRALKKPMFFPPEFFSVLFDVLTISILIIYSALLLATTKSFKHKVLYVTYAFLAILPVLCLNVLRSTILAFLATVALLICTKKMIKSLKMNKFISFTSFLLYIWLTFSLILRYAIFLIN